MKRSLTTLIAAGLLLGLGALAYLSLPSTTSAPVAAASAAQDQPAVLAAPSAPDVSHKYNDVSVVLNMASVTDAASLASHAGSYAKRVLRYNASTQSFQVYVVGNPGTNFPLSTGDAVFLLVDNTAPVVLSFVGDVPEKGGVSFALVSGSPPKYNFLSLPLDQDNLTTAAAVAADVGTGVLRVLRYRSETQSFQVYVVGNPGTDFPLALGEPFFLLLSTGAPANWP
jgi:hypothetical protein